MPYRKIRNIDSNIIKRFANSYGFPNNKRIFEFFCDVNGGKPVGFNFKYKNQNDEFVEVNMRRLLSFNAEDKYNIWDNIENFVYMEGIVIPFAADWEDNYVCYVNDNKTETVKFYVNDDCVMYDIYNEDGVLYTLESFFEDLEYV